MSRARDERRLVDGCAAEDLERAARGAPFELRVEVHGTPAAVAEPARHLLPDERLGARDDGLRFGRAVPRIGGVRLAQAPDRLASDRQLPSRRALVRAGELEQLPWSRLELPFALADPLAGTALPWQLAVGGAQLPVEP